MQPDIDSLLTAMASLTETEILALLTERYPDKVVFSTSFGMEDQVITDFIMKGHFPVKIFTLDTGRLLYHWGAYQRVLPYQDYPLLSRCKSDRGVCTRQWYQRLLPVRSLATCVLSYPQGRTA